MGHSEVDVAAHRSPARFVARALLLAGRALLVVAPVSVVVARLSRGSWAEVPLDAGLPDHPVPQLTMLIAFVFALVVPLLLLPVGSVWLVTVADGALTVPTVLGRRTVRVDSARLSAWWVPGRGWDSWFYVLRDRRGRWVIVGHSTLRLLPGEYRSAMTRLGGGAAGARLALGHGPPLRLTHRAGIYAAGLGLVIVWGVSTLLLISAAFGVVAG